MKNSIPIYLIALLISLLISCRQEFEFGDELLAESIVTTNMDSLIENPNEFNNDTIRIEGEVFFELENVVIVSKDFPIWVNTFEPAAKVDYGNKAFNTLNGNRVELIGIFKSGKSGHLGLCKGRLTEIFYIRNQ